MAGSRVMIDPDWPVQSIVKTLNESPAGIEAWWSPSLWTSDRRASGAWESASSVVVDLNYYDAIGERTPPSPDHIKLMRSQISSMPGSAWHSTPRGIRVIACFAESCGDPALWSKAARGLRYKITEWLRFWDLLADRVAHVAGYEVNREDEEQARARYFYGPRALVSGIQRGSTVRVLNEPPFDPVALADEVPGAAWAVPSPEVANELAARYRKSMRGDGPELSREENKAILAAVKAGILPMDFDLAEPIDPTGEEYARAAEVAADVGAGTLRLEEALKVDEQRKEKELAAAFSPPKPARPPDPPPHTDSDAPPSEEPEEVPPPMEELRPRPLAQVIPIRSEEKPAIRITTEEELVNDAAVAALCPDPRVFQRGHKLVQVLRGVEMIHGIHRPPDALTIAEIPVPRLREMLANAARWQKVDAASVAKRAAASGTANESASRKEPLKWAPAHPPVWSVQAVHARGQWSGIRPLTGITEWPRLRSDGTLLADPGYDTKTGLYYEPAGKVDPISQEPCGEEVAGAVAALREVVCDFPFASEDGFSAWLAALLTPIAFGAFDGPAPMFVAEASAPGSGKSKLWEAVSFILTGRSAATVPYTDDQDEMGKKITSCALSGDPLIFFDNCTKLGGDRLAQAVTSRTWKDRVLGKSENTPELPLDATWYANGTNIMYLNTLDRRCCVCRLESKLEHPEARPDAEFRHIPLEPWLRQERPRLLAAALTILRAYAVAGFPRVKPTSWGSFEGWSRLVKGCIDWLEIPFQDAPTASLAAGGELGELSATLDLWEHLDPRGKGIGVGEFLRIIDGEREDAERGNRKPSEVAQAFFDAIGLPLPNAKKFGRRIAQWKGRVCEGRFFFQAATLHKVAVWAVSKVADEDKGKQDQDIPTAYN
jgi:hypothetical protein